MATCRLMATQVEGGFMLCRVGSEDLGQALGVPEDVIVEIEDGRSFELFDAIELLIERRVVAGFVVLFADQHDRASKAAGE